MSHAAATDGPDGVYDRHSPAIRAMLNPMEARFASKSILRWVDGSRFGLFSNQ
jgi:hypothetical protein